MAEEVWAELQASDKSAKVFNQRECLTGNEETSYDNINLMVKEYEPFYQLWTTCDLWKQSNHGWLHDEWEKLDGA